MRTAYRLGLFAMVVLGALGSQACTSHDYILQQSGTGGGGGDDGTGGLIWSGTGGGSFPGGMGGEPWFDGTGGYEYPGTGGHEYPGTGGPTWPGIGGTGIGGNGIGGTIAGTGGRLEGTGGNPGTCSLVTTDAECQARIDCHSVFFDPGTCGCAASGCCARYSFCADGGWAQCNPVPLACAIATPYCQSPYVVSYRNNCFEGCVRQTECMP